MNNTKYSVIVYIDGRGHQIECGTKAPVTITTKMVSEDEPTKVVTDVRA